MATTYDAFTKIVVLKSRGVSLKKPFTYDAVCSTIYSSYIVVHKILLMITSRMLTY